MRIGVFDPYLDTLSGGEKYILSIASCLSKEHEVFIFWDKKKEAEIRKIAVRKLGIDLSSVKFYKNIFDKNTSSISRFIESRNFDAIIYLSDGSIPLIGTKLYIHFQFPVEWVDGNKLKTRIKLAFVKDKALKKKLWKDERRIFCKKALLKEFTPDLIIKTKNI